MCPIQKSVTLNLQHFSYTRPRDSLFVMDMKSFRESLSQSEPPDALSQALAGLWWDAKGDWAKAHESAQQDEGPAGAWVHAYLHRKEGDASNAAYWYGRAKTPPSRSSCEDEWQEIASSLIK